MNINHVVQRGKALTGQNKSNEGQRALIAAYEAIQDLLPEPPKGTWQAWIRLGKRAEKNLSYLKSLWSWKR